MDLVSDVLTEEFRQVIVTAKGDVATSSAISSIELDLSKFHNGRWALQLDDFFSRRSAPVVILAQGVACLAVAWWAQLSPRSYLRSVRGALFRSPLKIGFGQAAIAASAMRGPSQRLPFPSVVASDVTLYVERMLRLADGWGSRFVDLGAPLSGEPSNRRGGITEVEELLLGHLRLLDGAGEESRPAPAVSPRALLRQD